MGLKRESRLYIKDGDSLWVWKGLFNYFLTCYRLITRKINKQIDQQLNFKKYVIEFLFLKKRILVILWWTILRTCLIRGGIVLKEVIQSSINRISAVNNAACVQYENVKVVCPLLGRKQTSLFTVFMKKRPCACKSCKTNLFSPQLLGLVLFTGESIARKSPCSWLTPLCRKVESEKRICCRKGNPRGIKLSRYVSKWTMKLENNT